MIIIGALPATFVAVALACDIGRSNWLSTVYGLAAPLGALGLWLASFQDPSVISGSRLCTLGLLTIGLAAAGPFVVPVAISICLEPSLLKSQGQVLFLWILFGPSLCAPAFMVSHAVARLSSRSSRSRPERP